MKKQLMLVFAYVVSSTENVDVKDDGLKCNWAQSYTKWSKLIDDVAQQQRVMLNVAEWEGGFGASNSALDMTTGTTCAFVEINMDTGHAGVGDIIFS
jgi:hypothetical protein